MTNPDSTVACVSPAVTLHEELRAEMDLVAADLRTNREERRMYEALLADVRTESARLLAEGRALGFKVTTMATLAGVSRKTAHEMLRAVSDDE